MRRVNKHWLGHVQNEKDLARKKIQQRVGNMGLGLSA